MEKFSLHLTRPLSVLALTILTGCGFVHDERLIGPYHLNALDSDQEMSVCYALAGGDEVGRINETVFAVGWNDRYIVAKQHPKGDRKRTNYYYVEMALDSPSADPGVSVKGPLSESEFNARKTQLGLPDFRRIISSLE